MLFFHVAVFLLLLVLTSHLIFIFSQQIFWKKEHDGIDREFSFQAILLQSFSLPSYIMIHTPVRVISKVNCSLCLGDAIVDVQNNFEWHRT